MEELRDEPFALLGVNSDGVERGRQAVRENELTWRSFQDLPAGAERPISDAWGITGWPTLVVLDGDGTIRYRGHDGAAATSVVRDLLAKLRQRGR